MWRPIALGGVVLFIGAFAFSQGQEGFIGNVFRGFLEPLKFSEYWNQVTPENAGKWESIEPARDTMFWGMLDAIYDYAKGHGFVFKFHTLVWGKQQPMWIELLPAEEQEEEVEEWFAAVAARYPGIDLIDVVNEPLHAPPPYVEALGGTGETGWDWVVNAFTLARRYFPESVLLLNEYGVVADLGLAKKLLDVVSILEERGLIDGIGIQCHAFEMDSISRASLKEALDYLSTSGLPIYVSELDITGDDEIQLRRYQEKFPVIWEHPAVAGVTLWGYVEGQIWQGDAFLLHTDGTERPALRWLVDYVRKGDP
ncbi:endo-1,4-beta-xylanase [Candidatus Bipolaricaulota bacterium]|nr:endo-1,4-beta-xylanase [Candidatus Bipolaricaulota bacterium]